jgi:hypothetical protein
MLTKRMPSGRLNITRISPGKSKTAPAQYAPRDTPKILFRISDIASTIADVEI